MLGPFAQNRNAIIEKLYENRIVAKVNERNASGNAHFKVNKETWRQFKAGRAANEARGGAAADRI